MLAPHRDQVAHRRGVAPLDVPAQELAALREPDRVDGGCCAKDRLRGELLADGVDLFRYVSQERGLAVAGAAVGELDCVHVGVGVDGVG